jgi:hypothetical protein
MFTEAQARALRHPSLLAEETAHPRFASQTALGSIVLSINTGYE